MHYQLSINKNNDIINPNDTVKNIYSNNITRVNLSIHCILLDEKTSGHNRVGDLVVFLLKPPILSVLRSNPDTQLLNSTHEEFDGFTRMLAYSPLLARFENEDSLLMYIDIFSVHESQRNKNVGHSILNDITQFIEHNFKGMITSTYLTPQPLDEKDIELMKERLIRFYERNGFQNIDMQNKFIYLCRFEKISCIRTAI